MVLTVQYFCNGYLREYTIANGATIRIGDDVRKLELDRDSIHRALMRTEATEIEESSIEVEGVMKGGVLSIDCQSEGWGLPWGRTIITKSHWMARLTLRVPGVFGPQQNSPKSTSLHLKKTKLRSAVKRLSER